MNATFLDYASLGPEDLEFSALHSVVPGITLHEATSPADVIERIRDAEVVVVNKVVLDHDTLAAAGKLRLIAVTATGTNNIDIEAARALGIRVSNARDYGTTSVVQHAFSLMLALANQMPAYMSDVRDGTWSRQANFCLLHHPIMELRGKTLGIIGYGVLGRAVAEMARLWGMRVLIACLPGRDYASDPDTERLELDALLAQSDVVSVHCLLSESTRGLLGANELARMKPGALLVNVARGGIVDEAALLSALRSGHLGGAGVDVLDQEPPLEDDPMLSSELENLIVTPHCAWASRESRQRLVDQMVENLRAFLDTGEPVHVVC